MTILAFTTKSNKIINGKIYSSENQKQYNIENVFIIIRCDNKSIDTVRTNEKGEFYAIVPVGKQNKIDILYSGIGFGTVYLKHIKQLLSDTTYIQIDIANTFKKNIFGIAICPKCNKTNQVYKIQYGDAPIYTSQINDNGDTTFSPIRNGVYQAGSCVSTLQSAEWYCDRDKIEF